MIDNTISNRIDYIHLFCENLTDWVTSEKDVSFFAKLDKDSKITCGDIIPTKPSVNWLSKLHFTIKYGYKNATFDKHFIPNPNDTMHNLWKNAVNKAGNKKLPVLVYKKPYMPNSYVFIPYELYEHITRELIHCNMIRLRYSDIPNAYVFDLNEFLDKVKYKKLKKVINQL